MKKIEQLFDEKRDLHRTIEKVITFGVDQEKRLGNEIREYVVTPHMEEEFEDLLAKMQRAMEVGGPNEVGVWVSGFYGSGKSSFTKYLGLALDDAVHVDGQPFLKHLQDRFKKQTTKSLLAKVAKSYPASVVFLDLASEQLAGSTMEEISSVLFYKVLEHAGFSRNIKVAALERRIQKDGRFPEFLEMVRNKYKMEWENIQNDLLAIDSQIPAIAHEMYPQLFATPTAFTRAVAEIVQFEKDRVQEMLEIVRDYSGKEFIIFIIDEVGQYVAPSQHLILNLDGLAKNLKGIGDGKVWIMGTAQQTLTEDDPRAAINSPELYRLKDRFPITVDLPPSDIRQICYERLLKKSVAGKSTLQTLFESSGQALRQSTKLENAKFYAADFDSDTFVDLYPFLPSHFDILLQLLGALAKSTGGIGLRSAIKVIQDILIEGPEGQPPTCDQPVGSLVTLVTLFDALEKDIAQASPTTYAAYQKIGIRFPGSQLHHDIGKTVAVLQILNNIPVTRRNVAALMHPSVSAKSNYDAVEQATKELIDDTLVPFDDRDGGLCFLSERLSEIQKLRGEIPPRAVETRRIFNSAIKDIFEPLPSRKLFDTLTVTAGVKSRSGQLISPLAGDKNPIQMIIEFVSADDFDTKQMEIVDESRANSDRNNIYLLGKQSNEFEKMVLEIYRSEEISRRFRNDSDDEVRDYCNSQNDRAGEESQRLATKLEKAMFEGFFIFRAAETAVESRGIQLLEACKKFLGDDVAKEVFDKYKQAPIRVDTQVAEAFLKTENLGSVTQRQDPLGLVKKEGGSFRIDNDHAAICSIRDYLESQGSLAGNQLTNKFTSDPFGWSQDTLRYLVAAMLRSSDVKLKIGGTEIISPGQKAIEGLRNNNSFKSVLVELRVTKPDPKSLATAAKRLTELTGQAVLPLEQEISKSAAKFFASVQNDYGALAEKLNNLELPCGDGIRDVCDRMSQSMQADCSDAVTRLGASDETYNELILASKLTKAFQHGLGATITELKQAIQRIESLPDSGAVGNLRTETAEEITQLKNRLSADDFYEHGTDFSTALTSMSNAISKTAKSLQLEQETNVKTAKESLTQMPAWPLLNQARKSELLGQLDDYLVPVEPSYSGIKQQMDIAYSMGTKLHELRALVVPPIVTPTKEKLSDTLTIQAKLKSLDDFAELRKRVTEAEHKARAYTEFEIKVELE